jgi:hypothetical protein
VLLGEGREEKEEGEGVGQLGGSPWGLLGEAGAPGWLPVALLVREGRKERSIRWLLFAWEENRREKKTGGRRREEKREKRKEEGKKEKKRKENFSKLGNFWKNKRYLAKLVKKYFCCRKIFAEL